MFPLQHRLLLRQLPDFFRTARRWHSQNLTIFYREREGLSKAAIIIPQKKVKKATARHQLKRWLRTTLLPYLQEKPNQEIVIVLTRNVLKSEYQAVKTQLAQFWRL